MAWLPSEAQATTVSSPSNSQLNAINLINASLRSVEREKTFLHCKSESFSSTTLV